MTRPTVGALFAGYGGIELGLHDALGARPAWFSEFDTAPSKILAHRYPGVPNHGDVTRIDWANVEPVDIITGGSPCQDLSHAGKRAGMRAGTRSGLWASMCDAIDIIRPSLVIWENVRGALSAEADSTLERCGFCMDDRGGPSLRALGRVLGDLAELGYDAAWTGIRAADVGAPHGRFRVFVLAWPAADTGGVGRVGWTGVSGDGRQASVRGEAIDHPGYSALPLWGSREWRDLTLLRTPTAQLGVNGGSQHPDKRKAGGHGPTLADEVETYLNPSTPLLPTPVVNDMGAGKTVDAWDAWTDRLKSSHANGNGHGASLSIEALRLLPSPIASDGQGGPKRLAADGRTEADHGAQLRDLAPVLDFGQYAPAIARWEALTRLAPAPTEATGKGGAHRLSPRFVEWLMGLPDGWVTDPAIGISRNDQLKALGNGVVPQQCAAAVRHLLTIRATALEVAA